MSLESSTGSCGAKKSSRRMSALHWSLHDRHLRSHGVFGGCMSLESSTGSCGAKESSRRMSALPWCFMFGICAALESSVGGCIALESTSSVSSSAVSASRYLVFKLDAMESQMMERVQFTVLLSDPPMIPAAKGVCFVPPDVNFTCCSPVRNE